MKEIYSLDTDTIAALQWKELEKQLEYTLKNSPYYQEVFRLHGLHLARMQNYTEFSRIPLTTKEDLQKCNEDFLAVAKEKIIDLVTTSGTLGEPVSFALNEADLQRLAENEYQSFKMIGVKRSDIVQITTTLDRKFMAGMAYFLGLRKLGAGIIRSGSGLPRLQWESIERFRPKYLIAVPSFLLRLIEFARENGIDYQNSSVKAAICIGEPLRNSEFELNALGKKISEMWDIELFSTYASTEMATAFTECTEHTGNHSLQDLIYTEILDEKGSPVKPGEIGELVVTPLKTRSMPLLRFATGDMVKAYSGGCACGRNSLRISSIYGRKKQMIKLKGTTLYPQNIVEALNSFGKIDRFVIEALDSSVGTDRLIVKIPESTSKEQVEELREHFRAILHVTPEIEQLAPEQIDKLKFPKESRKPQVFLDHRKNIHS